jgi:H2-forming N5,N10-methylenetetrahydromethanopterin dehydrogenase-like enzyme
MILLLKVCLLATGQILWHSTRVLGNKSAHETISATEKELDIAMNIVENLIKSVYIIPQKVQKLNKK